jgi:AraC-like DNA-binding protein
MITYKELYVKDPLSYYINKLWILENRDSNGVHAYKTLVPNGCFNIAFINGQGVLAKFDTHVIELKKGIYFCGQATHSVNIEIMPDTKLNMVQVFPWTASLFVNCNMNLCTNNVIPIKEINNDFEFEARKIDKNDEYQISSFLHDQFNNFILKNGNTILLYKSCSIIMKNNGIDSIKDLCTQLNCSSRHLQKIFLKYIGLSPKEFSIIIKLRNAIDEIAYPSSTNNSLTSLALDADFYDQSHFNNIFKTRVKTQPRKFIPSSFILAFKKKS